MKSQNCIVILSLLFLIVACKSEGNSFEQAKNNDANSKKGKLFKIKSIKQRTKIKSASLKAIRNLVDIQIINPTIRVDLKYATSDNFMREVLYDTLRKAYLQKDIAIRLSECQEFLKNIKPDYSLLVYDALRPRKIQARMWRALDTIPVGERTKFVSSPKSGSVHNYGAAVDLTICDKNGKPIDMGAGYDDIREIAYPSLEPQFLASGELSVAQVANRKLLRKVMRRGGFINIPTEWWHFNAFPKIIVKRKYLIIE